MDDYKLKGIWIPKEIFFARELTPNEKLFFADVYHLDNKNGCYKSNKRFAEFHGVSERQIRNYIAKLRDLGLISVTTENVNHQGVLLEDMRVIRCLGKYAQDSKRSLDQYSDDELRSMGKRELMSRIGVDRATAMEEGEDRSGEVDELRGELTRKMNRKENS